MGYSADVAAVRKEYSERGRALLSARDRKLRQLEADRKVNVRALEDNHKKAVAEVRESWRSDDQMLHEELADRIEGLQR
jgi:TRAP-type C4-dicarboxylate transport system substrate-binding protein